MRRWARRGIVTSHFVEWQGAPVKSVKTGFKHAVKLAALWGKVTPHTLRHTAATWLMQRGVTIWQAAGYLGFLPRTPTDEKVGRAETPPARSCWSLPDLLRLKARRGPKKAAIAVAASILTAVYHMLRDGTFYNDLGPQHFARHVSRLKPVHHVVVRLIANHRYLIALKTVKGNGVVVKQLAPFNWRCSQCHGIDECDPARIARGQLRHRPITTEHHAVESETIDSVRDIGSDLSFGPCRMVGFGNHSGNLAPDIGIGGNGAKFARPRLPLTYPNGGFPDVVEHKGDLRTAPDQLRGFGKLRVEHAQIEREAELRQQFHASDKIVAKAPPGVIIVPLDQPAYATGQGKQRVIGQIGFRRFAILERH
jgi:hypothetical protein